MNWRDAPATTVLTALTLVVSAVLVVTGWLYPAAVLAGFVPARVEGLGYTPAALPLWLTPLSATLVHGGWAHIALNLVMLFYCGQQAERAVGASGIVVLYVVGAYAAAAGQWALDPASVAPMIGASGAISAVVAAYALFYGQRRAQQLGPVPAGIVHVAWLAAAWIGIQALIGFAGIGAAPVAVGAHIGGFIAGLVLARPLLLWRYRSA